MTTPKQIRVMLADDHPIMRDALRDALQDEGDFEVVGLTRDGVEAVRMEQSLAPEVVVMDVMMPHKDRVDACREIMQLRLDTRVLTANRALDGMTAVEQEILTMFASGRSYAQIAEPSGTKTVGVRNAVYRIQDKVEVHSKQELVA